ncbi:MAG TPA: hypothetical protein DCZ10_04765 [Pelotomaculum sp.]|nr:hypothetical protein [Pelotomaculum sp.]
MLNYVGKSIPKYDVMGHVTGKTVYPSDVKMPGMLICKTLRSPYKRARIHSIDISEALKVKGVHAVITKDDVPYNKFAMYPDQDVLAEEIVRFKGQNIAAVAADDKATTLEALSKIKLDIEELPAVVDPREAMKEGAPLVRPEGNRYPDGTLIYTNKMPSGAMRGFGVNVGQFAEQLQTEKLARTVGISPFDIRFVVYRIPPAMQVVPKSL